MINKGAEAMLLTVVNQLKRRINNISFYVFPLSVEEGMYERYGINELNYKTSKKSILLYFFLHFFRMLPLFLKYHKINTVNQLDICRHFNGIIDISGFSYGDYWGEIGMLHANIWLSEFNPSKSRFYIFAPQAFGPFENQRFFPLLENFITLPALICARDKESFQYLNNSIPINRERPNNLKLSPDIVFSFKESTDRPEKNNKRLKIGYAPNIHIKKLLFNKTGNDCYSELVLKDLQGISDFLPNCEIVLIPTEVYPKGEKYDDASICQDIANLCSLRNVSVFQSYQTSLNVYNEIGECSFLISSRYHGIIFALAQNIPVITIGWSHKYKELMDIFGINDLLVCPSLLGTQEILAEVKNLKKNRDQLSNQISNINKQIRKKNEVIFGQFSKIIGDLRW